jgi:cation diffusion facilitator CzcD-associated flavoprotein CzcO
MQNMNQTQRSKVLIVGSGGNGMAVAACLREAGIHDYLMITKHHEFGGAWHQNTYPGCGVDTPVSIYQLSCAVTYDWTRLYATQPELQAYFKRVAADLGLYDHVHFGTEMRSAQWLDDEACWCVITNGATYRADVLVLATGFLEEPVFPSIDGIDTFQGKIFHSSMWPDGYTGAGDRIAVVGTGSSALQIVPAMQRVAQQVFAFQRTPTHILRKGDRVFSEAELEQFRATPEIFLQMRQEAYDSQAAVWDEVILASSPEVSAKWEVEALRHLEEQVPDAELRRLLTPDHQIGCKRPGVNDDFYRALVQDNVELVPEAACAIGAGTIGTMSGRSVDVDTIVLATGFFFGGHILDQVTRRDGRTVAAAQQGHPRAYKSIAVSGCPNLFLVGGAAPNGQIWNGLACGEFAGRYIVEALNFMRATGVRALEVDENAESEWKERADKVLDKAPAISGGCVNYSQDARGRNKAAWPGSLASMEASLREFDATAYHVVAREEPSRGVAVAG